LNSDRLVGCLWSRDIERSIALFASAIVLYTFYSIALFVFSINRIRQNASHTNPISLFWYYIKQTFGERWNVPFNSAVASLNGTFHLSPHENILTIARINIHYLYNIQRRNDVYSTLNQRRKLSPRRWIDVEKGLTEMQIELFNVEILGCQSRNSNHNSCKMSVSPVI
jgi:hypothetical protein